MSPPKLFGAWAAITGHKASVLCLLITDIHTISMEYVTMDEKKTARNRKDLSGKRFGNLTVICRSDKRAPRGKRTVPLWECRCDCGAITYKATDKLTGVGKRMCADCASRYAMGKMVKAAGYMDGTQISRLKSEKPNVGNTSGARGVYFDKATGKWRARLRFKRKLLNFGTYTSFEDAVNARKKAEMEYFGEYLDEMPSS